MKKKKAYICSPLFADTPGEIRENMCMAKRYAKEVSQLLSCRATAIHGVLPELLDDNDPAERKLALDFGVMYLATCDLLVVCGERITSGMAVEIEAAEAFGIPIYIYVKGSLYAVIQNNRIDGHLRGIRVQPDNDRPDFLQQMLLYLLLNYMEGIDAGGL